MEALKNKKAVITGGSRGIGKAVAGVYLKNGAEVFLVARSESELAATQKELSKYGTIHTAAADISSEKDTRHLAGEIGKLWGTIDVLVNGAGIYGPIGPITEIDPGEWKKTLDINLFGTFLATRAFMPLMEARGGSIINFVGGGEGGYPNFSAYAASKGGVGRFTETAAVEFAAQKIRVNAIAPGAVNTKFLDELLAAGPQKAGKDIYEKSIKQKESGGVSPEKAAALCVFLASDASSGLSGKILSAVWDPYEDFPKHIKEIMSSDVYTSRRIRPQDRGFGWDK